MNALTLAALGTGFTFLMTAAGAAVVFLFKNEIKPSFQRVFLGFAAGVMIAASVWSLLIPSIEMAGEQGVPGWLPAAGGFALGALFLMALDALMPHLHPGSSEAEGVQTHHAAGAGCNTAQHSRGHGRGPGLCAGGRRRLIQCDAGGRDGAVFGHGAAKFP